MPAVLFSILFCVLLVPQSARAAVVFFSGFENGATTCPVAACEFNQGAQGTTQSIQTTTVHTGAYALQANPTTTGTGFIAHSLPAAVTTAYIRFYFRVATAPAANTEPIFILTNSANNVDACRLNLNSARKLELYTGTPTLLATGATVLALDTWYRIEIFADATPDQATVYIDGNQEIAAQNISAVADYGFLYLGKAANQNGQTVNLFYDDFALSNSALPGPGQIIARQGTAGTPSSNAFTTKTCSSCSFTSCAGSCATATSCCALSETPFGTAKLVSSATAGQAQTMLIAPFSSTVASFFGTQVIAPGDTINRCKAGVIAKTSSSTSRTHQIRVRDNGANTDTTIATTALDGWFEVYYTPSSTTTLDSDEVGGVEFSGTQTYTIEDAWLMCDYTPASATRSRSLMGVGL